MSSAQNVSPLPPLSMATFDEQGLRLWVLLLSAEKAAQSLDNLVDSRVLGHFLADFWDHRHLSLGDAPYHRLCLEIDSCIGTTSAPVGSDEETHIHHHNLWRLGSTYKNHVIRLFRSNTRHISSLFSLDCPPSFERLREDMLRAIRDTPKSKSDAKSVALIRDGYRCMLSGAIDIPFAFLYDEVAGLPGAGGETRAVHLFPALAQDTDKNYAAAALTILKLFRLEAEVESTHAGNVNNPRNILTLEDNLQFMFDQFNLWLEEVVDMPNTYDVVVPHASPKVYNKLPYRSPPRVTFTVAEQVLHECKQRDITPPALPDPKLIAVRASCARVVHLSGAAEQMNAIDLEVEQTLVLAEDGSSASFFESLLRLQANPIEFEA